MWHRALLSFLLLFLAQGMAPAAPQTVTLALLGDVMLGRGVAAAHPGGAGWEEAWAPLAPALRGADLALANLESPVTQAPLAAGVLAAARQAGADPAAGKDPAAIDLRAGPEGLAALQAAGLDLLVVANNHSYDSGAAGLADTLREITAAGLTPLGPGPEVILVERHGLRLAFLAFEEAASPLDLEAAARVVRRAGEGGAWVVVSVHWGGEYRPGASARQKEIARALAKAGAILIWGHHPHVLQPAAWVPGAGRSRPTLVLYSLGNALFDQLSPPDARRSALILVKLDRAGVQSVQAVPFQIDVPHGRVQAAGALEAELIFRRLGELAAPGTAD